MKTETKHTELPWSVSQERGSYFVKGERALVAGLYNHENSPLWAVAQEANAEFIVRACNSNDDLVAALRACREELNQWHDWAMHTRPDFPDSEGKAYCFRVLSQARAALAKARGETDDDK